MAETKTPTRIVKYSGPPQKSQYATPNVVASRQPVFGMQVQAQATSNNYNITTTPPGFYSPQHTASAWQIPTNRKEVYAWARYWKLNEALVATGLDFYSSFSMNGYKLECPNGAVREYFEKLCKEKLHLDKWLPQIAYEYYLYGDCFVLLEMDCPGCHGTGKDPHNGRICEHEGATWGGISIFDPNTIEVSASNFVTQEPVMHWIPNDQLKDICIKGKPEEIYNQIPPEIREQIKANQPIKLNPIAATHLKFNASPYETYGTSLIRRLFPTLAYRDKLRQAQWMVVDRHILPIKIVKVGSDQRPASEDDLSAVQEQLSQVANDPLLTLVVHHAFDLDFVGSAGKVLMLTEEYEMINEDILSGFQMNKALVHGEGPNYASAQVGLDALAARLNTFRNELKHWIEQKIFKPVSEWNNFTSVSPKGIEEIIYPEIVFNDLGLKENNQEIANLLQLRNRNEISLQTLLSKFDIDYDTEVDLLRQEEMGNMLTSPDLGLGVQEGGEIGAGGAMPPMGGAMPTEMPGAMGEGAPGAAGAPGMPGVGGDMGAPGGAPPPVAFSSNRMIREAKLADDIPLLDRIRMHKESVSEMKRMIVGETDLNIEKIVSEFEDEIDTIDFDPEWMPITAEGCDLIQMAKFAKNDNKNQDTAYHKWFNKAEMSLFDAIIKANQSQQLPLAFVAQYFVGSQKNLSVDGAFPSVRVCVEVDGETWHSNPTQISRDKKKDQTLWSLGWIVLRFTEDEVKEKIDQVMKVITRVVMERYNQSK